MIEQIAIALSSVAATFLSQDPKKSRRRWACLLGLIGQPFWFYATWKAGQWGIFALCFFYTASWARGVRTYWMRGA